MSHNVSVSDIRRAQDSEGVNPLEGTLGYCTCAQVAGSAKRRKKCGSSVAYKTIGTVLSQE